MVPWRIRLAYAAPAVALAAFGVPIFVYLPKFYSDVVGLDLALMGYILLGVRLLDGVTDPLTGWLSDRTRSRWGRRRPWILAGALPLAATLLMLFWPPALSPAGAAAWFTVWIVLVYVFWTAVMVPYESLGAEISFDYDERTTLLGLRDGMVILGTLIAAAAPLAIASVLGLVGAEGTLTASAERTKFLGMALVYAPLILATCAWCAAVVPELPPRARRRAGTDWCAVWANRPFRVLLASYTISALGSNLPAVLITYFVTYVLQSTRVDQFLLLYFVVAMACLPGWIWLARRIEKRTAWMIAIVVNTGAFSGVSLLGAGDELLYGILVSLSGIGFGATLALPSSMQADVIDYDELYSGERREGMYVGLWAIARKLSAAVGVGLAFPIIGWAGYLPNVPQTPQVIGAIKLMYVGLPVVCNVVALLVLLAYPITRQRHHAIIAAIRARAAGEDVVDPLHPERTLPGLPAGEVGEVC